MKKILIVEDDQLVASAYKKRFGEAGYQVEWAPDGLEGIKMVGTNKPDIVLLDLLMPRLDGIEVLKYIRTHPELKNLPVVVFSNSYMTNLVESAWRNGADQCLMKASTTPAQLFDAVNKAIQKAAARAAAAGMPSAPVGPIVPLPGAGTGNSVPSIGEGIPAASQVRLPVAPAVPPVSPLQSAPAVARGFGTTMTMRSACGHPTSMVTRIPEVDPEFQAQIRQLFLASAPAKLAAMRDAATAFVQDQGSSMQLPLLGDLFGKIHSLTGNAAVAGCARVAHFASTFEAFLQELQQKPKFINPSTVRCVSRAIGIIEDLFRAAETGAGETDPHRPVLVITGDVMSSQTIGMALEKGNLPATIATDPAHALSLVPRGPYSGVVMSVNLPSISGFELCAQLQSHEAFGRTPVLFITELKDFVAHSNPENIGENDIMGSPYLLIELTLRALSLAEGGRLQRLSAAA